MKDTMKVQELELARGLFDILRMERISPQEYYVSLLFLSIYKREIETRTSMDIGSHFFVFDIEDTSFYKECTKETNDIIDFFRPVLSVLSSNGVRDIFYLLSSIDKSYFINSFSEIFDRVLYQIVKSQGKSAGEYIQPLEITRLVCNLADIKSASKVFNPFAGLASFATQLKGNQSYYGQELVQATWIIGKLRLLAYGESEQTEYVCEDSIVNWPSNDVKYDCIISNPPFGLGINQRQEVFGYSVRTVDQLLLLKGIESLTSNGKLIVLLPQGFLFKPGQDQKIRQMLIEEDLIDTIISLPGGLLANTNISFVALVLNKAKEHVNKVRLVDATSFVSSKKTKDKVLDDLALTTFLQQGKVDKEVVRIVDRHDIVSQKYNLTIGRYFIADSVLALQKKKTTCKLGNLLDVIKGEKGDSPVKGKLIRNRDLKDDKIDFVLDLSSIEEEKITVSHVRKVEESCLLVATTWNSLKPTYFQYTGEPIYIPQDLVCLKIDEDKVDKTYLINELHADYVLEQLESFRFGTAVQRISREDLLSVIIDLLSTKEQVAKAKGILETAERIKVLEQERNALIHGNSFDQFNEFASLKHTLGRPRQNILDWSVNLHDFLSTKTEVIEDINKEFTDFYEFDILSALSMIKEEVGFITEVLEKGENGFIVSEYEKTLISLSEINSLVNTYSGKGLKYQVIKQVLKNSSLKERGIYANQALLKTLLDNIFTNAEKYAFDDNLKSNEVVITLNEIDGFLVLEIKNNGKIFPKHFDREKFISKYSTANTEKGTGLGGYDIHRIAKYFDDENWILDLNNDPVYKVKFKFHFPIKLLK
ncbi:N-6 DNA methylase [Myroides odoratimimus]|uniref:N-6 DNA methylase n=1 Tax=Myroides odoratimimus TaxID=76832 RepID=UPI003D2F39BB